MCQVFIILTELCRVKHAVHLTSARLCRLLQVRLSCAQVLLEFARKQRSMTCVPCYKGVTICVSIPSTELCSRAFGGRSHMFCTCEVGTLASKCCHSVLDTVAPKWQRGLLCAPLKVNTSTADMKQRYDSCALYHTSEISV